jgi:hypothetical protein
LPVGPLHIHLHEGAGQFFHFPGRARLAGAKPHGDILHPHRLSRLEDKVTDDAVALVEQAQHRDPVGHRRDPRLFG